MAKNYKELLNHVSAFIVNADVLTGNLVQVDPDGELISTINLADAYAIKSALAKGYKIYVISAEANNGLMKRLQKIGVTKIDFQVYDSQVSMMNYINDHEMQPEEVLFMGTDLPDYNAMNFAVISACQQDAAPEVKSAAKYISHKNGGQGALRDVIEQVMKVRGDWMPDAS